MKHGFKFAVAAAAIAAFAVPAANAKSMGGFGGGHPVVMHAAPHFAGKGPSIHHSVPHVVQHSVPHSVPHVRNHVVQGGGNWNGQHHEHHGHHHHHHRRFFAAYPLYDYDYGYSNGCYWLWQRYLDTGNPRWKHRYYDCIE